MVKRMRIPATDKVFYGINYTTLIVAALVVLIPFLNIIANSISSPYEVAAGRVSLWPVQPTLEVWQRLLKNDSLRRSYLNTVIYVTGGTLINLAVTFLCAYPLSKPNLLGKTPFVIFLLIPSYFSGGLIPTYLTYRNLGILDTRWVMLIPGALNFGNMIIARTFIQANIPKELYESAEIDGAGHIRTFASIVLPLSIPLIAVLTLFFAVGHWNNYFNAMMFLKSQDLWNIQLELRAAMSNIQSAIADISNLQEQHRAFVHAEAAKYVMIMLTMLPIMVIYPFVQKHFVKGIMIGALKG